MKRTVLYVISIILLSNCNLVFDKENKESENNVDTTTTTTSKNFEDFINMFVDIDLPIIIDTTQLYRWRDYDEWKPLTTSKLHYVKVNEVFEKCGDPPFPLYDVSPIGKFQITDSVICAVVFLKMVDKCPNEAAYERVFLLSYDTVGQQISHLEIASGLHLGATSEWVFCEITTDLMIRQNMYEIFWFADEPEPEKTESALFKIKPNGLIKKIDS